jgi:hypothetical protein
MTALIDGHVHVHSCFDHAQVFRAAERNFNHAARSLRLTDSYTGVLLLTESAGDHFFRWARETPTERDQDGWSYHRTAESDALVVQRGDETRLVLVAGRQVVTSESLEILAIGRDLNCPDGQPIGSALEHIRNDGALAVIPWGFGKWWFGRGRIVRKLVKNANPLDLFLGDNGGRPRLGVRPPMFALADARGIRILPGSDPLPFARQAASVGSYGFALDLQLESDRPVEQIRARLADRGAVIRPFGRGERLLPFAWYQLAMQIRKRKTKRAA